jgi:hypothetical protein
MRNLHEWYMRTTKKKGCTAIEVQVIKEHFTHSWLRW